MQQEANDIIIIGSGIGALVSAALLSKEGYKVCVLEKNKQIGGCLQGFGIAGNYFESAIHYIGSLDKGQTLHKLFTYLGIYDQLKLTRLDIDCFDKIILEGEEYKFAQGHELFSETLISKFPNEAQAIKKYVEDMHYVCSHFPLYNLEVGDYERKLMVSGKGLQESLDALSSNETLKQVLTGNNLLYAGDYHSSPFFIHALIENSFIESSWKCTEGTSQIAKLLLNVIQQHGGEVLRNVELKRIVEQQGLVTFVQDVEGNKYYAKHFISNVHPQLTYQMLDSNLIRPVTIKRINQLENTLSTFIVNISLKEKSLPFLNHNVYYHTSSNVWKDIESKGMHAPTSFALFYGQDKEHPQFANTLSIITYINSIRTDKWNASFHSTSHRQEREVSYQEFKQQQIELIIDALSDYIPNLNAYIKQVDACTPLTLRDYLNTPNGSLYGLRKTIEAPLQATLATRTKIPNLSFTGQNVNLHGVLGVSLTSIVNTADFVGMEYLLKKINDKTN